VYSASVFCSGLLLLVLNLQLIARSARVPANRHQGVAVLFRLDDYPLPRFVRSLTLLRLVARLARISQCAPTAQITGG
jgi:hypothetical protein